MPCALNCPRTQIRFYFFSKNNLFSFMMH
uniref:Uncharacterized protein n=1 Tax=Rhizophora mucronata TaxID=61149 RepID=A0A2P2PTS9_RHIMU